MPCHLVIVKGTEYFDVKTSGYVDSPVTDILQMIGRAGRPQFDESGVACIFVHEPKKNFYRKFLHEPFPVESSLHNQLHEHINAEINNNSLHDLRDCIEYLTWTYFYRRLIMNPSYYNLSGNSVEQVEKYLENLILLVINDLEKSKCVEVLEDSTYQSTFLGKIASFYYLHYTTVGLFHDRIQTITKTFLDRDSNNNHSDVDGKGISLAKKEMLLMNEILFLLCDAPEFSELPVRHNEDILNEELADQLTCDIGHRDYDSPHAKAYLLLIAHFQRCKLPISDYINDTKSVLDQFPRVLNSLIDIAAELGELEVVLCCMKISQMVIQVCVSNNFIFTTVLFQQ